MHREPCSHTLFSVAETSDKAMMMRQTIPSIMILLFSFAVSSSAYATPKGTPELNRRAMAGLWRLLTTNPMSLGVSKSPMKEFTVYPKKCKEFLLMLKEDGSFQQYDDKDKKAKMCGMWDFLDGNLILAADSQTREQQQQQQQLSIPQRDTILVGKVVATSEQSLGDDFKNNTNTMDVHLSVPQGSVKVGKFFYPKHHPSFFEQPIFRPIPTGSFQLQQVLGKLNMKYMEEEEDVEKFRRDDFNDKRFFLTSHPLEHKPKGRLRWSIKYNKFVEDAPRKKSQPNEDITTTNIRVMEVEFFSNHTFATVAGLGEGTVLRGKWDIVGSKRDQLWMQVWRFGFGRSVSGSVYSEGKSLSHNDAQTYWGEISYTHNDKVDDEETIDTVVVQDADSSDDATMPKQLQVIGSVLSGWGLEPEPVARFLMKESSIDELEEQEDEEDMTEEDLECTFEKKSEEGDIDWSTAFQ